jgi:hypothetical protein
MATSGYTDVNVVSTGHIKLRYSWTAGTQNVANNFTPVTWKLQLISTNSGANIISSASKTYTVTTDGTAATGTDTVGINGGQTRTLATGSKNIYHNSDGTKSFSYSFSQQFNITYSGVYIGTISGSGTGTLNTIPRASILGAISNFTIGSNITISLTKYSSSFTDTLRIYLNDALIKTVSNITSGSTVNFTTAELNTIYAAMPNVASAVFKFVNTTTSGSTTVGTSTRTATGTITASIKPAISNVALTEAVSGIAAQFGAFIQNKSRATVSVTYTVGTGSSLNNIQIKLNGETLTSNNATTNILNTAGSNTCTVTVTDSRGRTDTATQTFDVTAYASPTITTLTVVRCTQDGTLDDMGEYVKVNASATITALSNMNTKQFELQYKQKSSATWETAQTYTSSYTYTVTDSIISNISPDSPYDFRIVATDFFGDVTKSVEVQSGFSIIDLKNNGKGIAFGKVSNLDAMEIGLPIYDRFETQILNGLSLYSSGGSLDPSTSIEELILTSTNTPTSSFWYVRTIFYSTKSETANRTQIAYPYSANANNITNKIFVRTYVSGTGWNNWRAINETTNTSENIVGNSLVGNNLSFEWGTVIVKSQGANKPTQHTIKFNRTYQYAPLVLPIIQTAAIGTILLGVSISATTTTSATLCVTRTDTGGSIVNFLIIGKVV